MPEQVRNLYNRYYAPMLVVLIAVLSIGFGYSIGVRESLSSLVALSDQQAKERKSINARHARQIGSLHKQLSLSRAETKEALMMLRGEK